MAAPVAEEPARIGPYVFTDEVPIDEPLLAILTARRVLRGRRALRGLGIAVSPAVVIACLAALGANTNVLSAIGALSIFVLLGGLGYAAWYVAIRGSTVSHLQHGVVWRFALDEQWLGDQSGDQEELPSSIEVFPIPLLLARIGDRIIENDVPVTIGASEWPDNLGPPPTAAGAGMAYPSR